MEGVALLAAAAGTLHRQLCSCATNSFEERAGRADLFDEGEKLPPPPPYRSPYASHIVPTSARPRATLQDAWLDLLDEGEQRAHEHVHDEVSADAQEDAGAEKVEQIGRPVVLRRGVPSASGTPAVGGSGAQKGRARPPPPPPSSY